MYKVALVITRLVKGGARKVVLDIAKGLDKNVYNVTLFTGPESMPDENSLNEIRDKKIRIEILNDMVRRVSVWKDLKTLLKLYTIFRRSNFSIVHSHTSKAGFLGCISAKLAGVPVIIYSPHGHIFSLRGEISEVSGNRLRLRFFFYLRRLASLCADRIVALSQSDKREQAALGLAPEYKYVVIPNGIDPTEFSIKGKNNISGNKKPADSNSLSKEYPILGMIARLTGEKGHKYLLESLVEVKESYRDVLLWIIGEGPLRHEMEKKVIELGLCPNVVFMGLLEDIPGILGKIDIVVLPSLYEAFGIVILEAMAMKKPVVATDVGGVSEVVENGRTGILVAPGDSHGLAEAIIRLADDKELSKIMGDNGYERVIKFFTKQEMLRKVDTLYRELASNVKGKA